MKSFNVCIPLSNPTISLVKIAEKEGDVIEIWADKLDEMDYAKQLENFISVSKKPILVTCKDPSEKGGFWGGEQAKIQRLITACEAGAIFVDCGSQTSQNSLNKLKAACKKVGSKLIISTHYWNKTPKIEELERHALGLKKRGADIVKIATTIKKWNDTVILFELATRLKKRKLPFVLVGMGPLSKVARIGCAVLGGMWTYISLDSKSATAPGQLSLMELENL